MADQAETKSKWKKTASAPRRRNKERKVKKAEANAAAVAAPAAQEQPEGRPFMTRMLTVGVASYLAHKVWTKRKAITSGWYGEEQTETEQGVVTVFEYLSSMGLIFGMGILVGVIFSKVAKWLKGTPAPEAQ